MKQLFTLMLVMSYALCFNNIPNKFHYNAYVY